MLGSNNYLGLTGDPRVKDAARDALERYGTGLTGSRFLNGTTPLHLELERELAEWMGAEDVIVFTTGHQANVGCLGHDPRPGRHGYLRLRRPRLDPRRRQALRRQAAPVPPQPDGQARADARARGRRRRRRAGRRRRRLLDGGRRLRPAGDRRAVRAPRRAPDGRRGPRRRRPRRPRRRHLRALRPRGPRRPADGHLLQEPRLLRRLHRRPRRGDRLPAGHLAPVHLHRRGRPGRRRRRPRARCG